MLKPRARKVKILATLGPASSSPEMIRALMEAGADAFRINMSHGEQADKVALVEAIRGLEKTLRRPTTILFDLQGPKLRVGRFKGGSVMLETGQRFVLDVSPAQGDAARVQLPHPELFASLKAGDRLLIDDGKVRLKALDVSDERIEAEVMVGGKVSNSKGVNVPDVVVPIPALTDKDRSDLAFALEQGADFIALSFVQRPEDVVEARDLVGDKAGLLAKIEKPHALDHLDEIISLVDAVMVARGDLGVELPPEDVPPAQNRIVAAARQAGRPVVVATQMLESMIVSPSPTRAEVSDVANAIYDGADAIMLSAESAAGQYPVEAVATMNRIAEEVESDSVYRGILDAQRAEPESTGADAIADAARHIADTLDLSGVICWTSSGSTALRVARERPRPPIVALSPNMATGRRLAVVWGVHCVVTEDARDQDDMVERACRIAFREGFARSGQRVIVVAGVPLGTPGATNMLRIAYVGADAAND